MTAGDVMPASLTFNSISASVPLTILYVSSNPPVITAAGVFLGLPPLTSASVICARCEKIYVGKRNGRHSMAQEEINELLLKKANEGKLVVRLKGGDP